MAGLFDFLTGAGGGVEAFFADPNMQRMLGELGTGFSTGQPIGQILGEAGSTLAERRAAQQAGQQVLGGMKSPGDLFMDLIKSDQKAKAEAGAAQQTPGISPSSLVTGQAAQRKGGDLMSQILEALRKDPTGATLLGPKEDMGTLDSINITDGGITLKAPNASKTQPFGDLAEQRPLEAIPGGVKPTPREGGPIIPPQPDRLSPDLVADRGQDLRDFFNAPIV